MLLNENQPHDNPWSRTKTNDDNDTPKVIAPPKSKWAGLISEIDS